MKLVTSKKFTLIGTPQGHEIKDPNGISAHSYVPYYGYAHTHLQSWNSPPMSSMISTWTSVRTLQPRNST